MKATMFAVIGIYCISYTIGFLYGAIVGHRKCKEESFAHHEQQAMSIANSH